MRAPQPIGYRERRYFFLYNITRCQIMFPIARFFPTGKCDSYSHRETLWDLGGGGVFPNVFRPIIFEYFTRNSAGGVINFCTGDAVKGAVCRGAVWRSLEGPGKSHGRSSALNSNRWHAPVPHPPL